MTAAPSSTQPVTEHTPTPWTYADVFGAGLEIRAPVYQVAGVELPKGMPDAPIKIFQFTAPQLIQIAAERWVQFEPTGWSEMQEANAAFIVEAVNSHAALKSQIKSLEGTIDLLEANARVQAKLLADTGRRAEELTKALEDLQDAEQAYRMCHDLDGDGHVNTGRAWDKMRRAGRRARSALSLEGSK